jgi:hypothetical protein
MRNEFIDLLTSLGFTEADQKTDLGTVIPYVWYGVRKTGKLHEYVSVVTYSPEFVGKSAKEISELNGDVVECVYELFLTKYESRKPKGLLKGSEMASKGYNHVLGQLPRKLNELYDLVSISDGELQSKADQLLASLKLMEANKK